MIINQNKYFFKTKVKVMIIRIYSLHFIATPRMSDPEGYW